MDGANKSAERQNESLASAIEATASFLAALFEESDTVLYRPIEIWIEDGKKRSLTDYRNTLYRPAVPGTIRSTMRRASGASSSVSASALCGGRSTPVTKPTGASSA